jgi:beta-glucosidase
MDGDEVPQIYLGAPTAQPVDVAFPLRKLVAFERVSLMAGQTKTVRFHVPERALQFWSTARHGWVTGLGKRMVMVGASSRDFRVQQPLDIGGEVP